MWLRTPKTRSMTSAISASAIARDVAGALGQALLKNPEVRKKVEGCVDHLASKH